MTWVLKNRTLAGSPFLADYDCAECGRFELLSVRDDNGDPPEDVPCETCGQPSVRVWATKIANPAFIPTAINPPGATRNDERDPRALDTRDLAEGKVTKAEWRKKQLEITKARRHAKRIKAGRAVKKIQIDSVGVK